MEKMTYAMAISSVVKPAVKQNSQEVKASAHTLGGAPDSTAVHRVARGRDDVIEATNAKSLKTPWRTYNSTCSTGCQTDPEPVEAFTPTSMDYATQTETMPEEKMSQTSTDQELQEDEEGIIFAKSDMFAIASMFDMIDILHKYASSRMHKDKNYADNIKNFKRACDKMKEGGYWSESEDQDEENEAEKTYQEPVSRC